MTCRRRASSCAASFGLRPAPSGACARLTRRSPPPQGLVDVRHAHLEDRSEFINPPPTVDRRHHAFAQVLRVGLAHWLSPNESIHSHKARLSGVGLL